MSTCVRPSCRKKATYELTLARLGGPDVPATRIQQWQFCGDDRDIVQQAIADAGKVTIPRVPNTHPPLGGVSTINLGAQAELDKEDQELRDRAAAEEAMTRAAAASNEEAKPAMPDGLVTRRGRAVASPPAL